MEFSNKNLIFILVCALLSVAYIVYGMVLEEEIITYVGFGLGMFSALFLQSMTIFFIELWESGRINK